MDEQHTKPEFQKRVDDMFRRDCLFAWVFVIWLWLTYAFVYFVITFVSEAAAKTDIQIALIAGGLLVGIYNTASTVAMIRHYREDKQFIYRVDLRQLDAVRAAKANK
ncbi:MAG: hypothetical protein Kow0092_11240 [Deferrisomatales bacterium]